MTGRISKAEVTATGTTTPRSLADWASKETLTYNNIAEAKADVKLDIGQSVKTLGYYSAGDGGGAEYIVVASGTRTDDEGSYHDMSNGNQLELIACNDSVSSLQYGVVADGVKDDTDAFLRYVNAINGGVISGSHFKIPEGVLNLQSLTSQITITKNNPTISGEGIQLSRIIWNDDSPARRLFGFSGPLGTVDIQDFTIKGSHDVNLSQMSGAYPFIVEDADTVRIHRYRSEYSRDIAIVVREAASVSVTDCEVFNSARDGINIANCSFATVANNMIAYTDDDCIAVHNQYYSDQRTHVITGNKIRFSQGMKLLGSHCSSITGNTMDFCFGNAINLQTRALPTLEGGAATFGVTITGNSINNQINRAYIDGLNNSGDIIAISSDSAQAGVLLEIPGEVRVGIGRTDDVYSHYRNSRTPEQDNTDTPIPNSSGITIAGNLFHRDIPTSGMFSVLGFGLFKMRDGDFDVDLSQLDCATPKFININTGNVKNVNVTGNSHIGGGYFLSLVGDDNIYGWKVSGNYIYDSEGLLISSPTSVTYEIDFADNTVDLDPYFKNTDHKLAGGWNSLGAATAVVLQGARGVSLQGNTFKNASRITDVDFDNALRDGVIMADNNRVYSDPNSFGFNAANNGVGYIPELGDTRVVNYDASSLSATYNTVTNELLRSSKNTPTSGKYLTGWVVRSSTPVVAGSAPEEYIVLGWLRLTTGTDHVLGTDWREVRAATS